MPTMVREAWTDERLDDLKDHMDEGFRDVKAEIREVKVEIKSTRTELKQEIRDVRDRFDERFDRLTYTLIAALIGLFATHYLG
jgi:DNA anti-recombination protein RmuC